MEELGRTITQKTRKTVFDQHVEKLSLNLLKATGDIPFVHVDESKYKVDF